MQNVLYMLALLTVDPAWAAALADGYEWVSAQYLLKQHYPQVDLALPLFITEVASVAQATEVKQRLLNAYPQQHSVTVLTADSNNLPAHQVVTLGELEQKASLPSSVIFYLPPCPQAGVTALQAIVAHLRAPEGCPWDRAQTLQSMRHDLLSECAEVLEAIDAEADGHDNSQHIAEELGDLLMAAVLMIQIATEAQRFQMADVIHGVVTKLIRRHPHVFGDTVVDGVQTVLANWEAIKAQEKAAKGQIANHPLDGVPASLPALEKARQLQSKAAKAKLLDRNALVQSLPELATRLGPSPDEKQLGELLWQLVALAHQFDLNPEDALRHYAVHFRQTAALEGD
ncbi:MAG: MazG family protein [Caldilineaceae bacterium]